MPSFDFSKLGYYRNLFLFTFVTSRLALILPPSEITADNSGSWSDSNPIVIQCLKKTGSANWTRSWSEWDYNPIRLTRQKRVYTLSARLAYAASSGWSASFPSRSTSSSSSRSWSSTCCQRLPSQVQASPRNPWTLVSAWHDIIGWSSGHSNSETFSYFGFPLLLSFSIFGS